MLIFKNLHSSVVHSFLKRLCRYVPRANRGFFDNFWLQKIHQSEGRRSYNCPISNYCKAYMPVCSIEQLQFCYAPLHPRADV